MGLSTLLSFILDSLLLPKNILLRMARSPSLSNHIIQMTPSRLRMPRLRRSRLEQLFDLLERLPSRLGVRDECLDGGCETERPKDDEDLPGDVLECRGDEETDGEVEEPMTRATLAGFSGM